jgi:hypothetical protein
LEVAAEERRLSDRGVRGLRRAQPHSVCIVNRLPRFSGVLVKSFTTRQGGEVLTDGHSPWVCETALA